MSLKRHHRVFPGLLERFGIKPDIFVETGTAAGATSKAVSPLFRQVYTIELSPQYWQAAIIQFRYTNVIPIFGDSAQMLSQLIPTIQEPACFFLDAHFVGGSKRYPFLATGNPLPLWDELKAIKARAIRDIVIVDDTYDFGQEDIGWKDVTEQSILHLVQPTDHCIVSRDALAMLLN